ncbi:MAG TPA: hypothetical protein PKY59_02020 [Pyrinomonadaceae bacterium]|nr:hypothetical protein [Pyrinomonadaceae bacterium]
MKSFLFTSLFILTFSLSAFSQTNGTAKCPDMQIYGPPGLPNENQEVNFTLSVKNVEENSLQYKWTSSAGDIIQGQGTPKITVRQLPKLGSITAVVEITGLPEGCPNTFSENLIADPLPKSNLIDEFSIVPHRIDKSKIDYLISRMQAEPYAQVFIIENFAPKTTKAAIKRKFKLISDYISKIRKQDISRFTFVTGNMNGNKTQFWLVPAGATPPTP